MNAHLSVAGQTYERIVPDTLDLAARASSALNGLGGTIDPGMATIYFFIVYAKQKPYMCHQVSDNEIDVKITACFPMMRVMCGSKQHEDVEVLHRAAVLSRIDDGFYWSTYEPEKPWKHRDAFYTDKLIKDVRPEDFTAVFGDARLIRHFVEWMDVDDSPEWGRLAGELAAGQQKIAIYKDDYAYYPDGGFGQAFAYPRRSGWLRTDEPRSEVEGIEGSVACYYGNQIQAMSKLYAVNGDTKAIDLAGRLAKFIMRPGFWGGTPDPENKETLLNRMPERLPDPASIPGHELGHWYTHFHARAITLRGLLEYGKVTGNLSVLEFVRRSYEFSLSVGIPRIGFIDTYPATGSPCMEACALGDLIGLAIRLTDCGMGDYWDDVDACVRNHLAESQLLDAQRLRDIAAGSPPSDPGDYGWPAYPVYDRQGEFENVIERSLGLFGSTPQISGIPVPWIMQCCTGNAVNGLYYAWEGALRESGTTAAVNLLINRAGKLVDVDSWIPYDGRVEIVSKSAARVMVRVPGWVALKDVAYSIDGNPYTPGLAGRYAIFDGLSKGSTIRLDFPLHEEEASYTVGFRTKFEKTYRIGFRGSTAIDISPGDDSPTTYPMYLRDHLKSPGAAPTRKVTRFVADRIITNW
jgi:hypothetical protein